MIKSYFLYDDILSKYRELEDAQTILNKINDGKMSICLDNIGFPLFSKALYDRHKNDRDGLHRMCAEVRDGFIKWYENEILRIGEKITELERYAMAELVFQIHIFLPAMRARAIPVIYHEYGQHVRSHTDSNA